MTNLSQESEQIKWHLQCVNKEIDANSYAIIGKNIDKNNRIQELLVIKRMHLKALNKINEELLKL